MNFVQLQVRQLAMPSPPFSAPRTLLGVRLSLFHKSSGYLLRRTLAGTWVFQCFMGGQPRPLTKVPLTVLIISSLVGRRNPCLLQEG
ncbi:hypothetical protein LINPERHAP2_LOCUS40949 [Linum perenne]